MTESFQGLRLGRGFKQSTGSPRLKEEAGEDEGRPGGVRVEPVSGSPGVAPRGSRVSSVRRGRQRRPLGPWRIWVAEDGKSPVTRRLESRPEAPASDWTSGAGVCAGTRGTGRGEVADEVAVPSCERRSLCREADARARRGRGSQSQPFRSGGSCGEAERAGRGCERRGRREARRTPSGAGICAGVEAERSGVGRGGARAL